MLLAVTACGQSGTGPRQSERESDSLKTNYESTPSDAAAPSPRMAVSPTNSFPPPEISPPAAPGVAFNYRYAFRLPANRIGQIQEEHAAACEKLGAERCRITGMLYRLVNDRD